MTGLPLTVEMVHNMVLYLAECVVHVELLGYEIAQAATL